MKLKEIKESCLLCNSHSFQLLREKDRNGKTVLNYICNCCGFIQVFPRMTSFEKEKLYKEGEFSTTARKSKKLSDEKIKASERTSYKYFSILENYFKEGLYVREKSCLEVGCGSGSFLRYMKVAGWSVEGIEPDKVFSEKGKIIYDVKIHNIFIENFKTNKRYDLISSFHVIEHVSDPNTFLNLIYNLLNDDGVLYLECPSIDFMYGESLDFFFWDVHVNTFSNKTLSAFLMKNGFEVLQMFENNSFTNVIARKVKEKKTKYIESFDEVERIKSLLKSREQQLSVKKNHFYRFKKVVKKIIKKSLRFKKNIFIEREEDNFNYKISHLGFHHSKNTGDIALFESLRKQFQSHIGTIDFKLLNVHQVLDISIVNEINKTDALIIGGGGLFLKDTNKNDISGWQWPCSIEMLEKIKVPIIIYAVGYNRFRQQDDFEPFFKENINALFNISVFIGLRNHGSISGVKNYLNKENVQKVVYQPCSTTLLKQDYDINLENQKYIAFNIAFDRHYMRYGSADNENKILNSVCRVIKKILEKGHEVVFFSHVVEDVQFGIWLKANGINIRHVNLVGKGIEDTIKEYQKFKLVVGTRGHSQMIPFGLNIQIVSIISHDKLRYFLEDNSLMSNGVDVENINFEEELLNVINKELENRSDFTAKHEHIKKITKKNLNNIKSKIDNYKRKRANY